MNSSKELLVFQNRPNGLTYEIELIGKYTKNGFVCKLTCDNDCWEDELEKGNLLKYINYQQEERFVEITKVQVFNQWIYLYLDYVSAVEYIAKTFKGKVVDK
jgi:hypothetical protein